MLLIKNNLAKRIYEYNEHYCSTLGYKLSADLSSKFFGNLSLLAVLYTARVKTVLFVYSKLCHGT